MKRKVNDNDSVSYWKSMVDIITTLMMVILLILMFFMINFLVNRNEEEFEPNDRTGYYDNAYDYDTTPTATPTPSLTPTPYDEYHDNGDGGGGGNDTTPTPVPTMPVNPEFEGDSDKAAIYVVLYDEETNQVVEAEGIAFELYTSAGSRQTLSTHYPVLESFTQFVTTDDGSFYLPEKVRLGNYYFHQLTPIDGYDFTADYYFDVDESYDWESPYIVRIPLGASKNNIQVQINDSVNGTGLSGVVFDVVADGDVVTPDGTLRYRDGEVVDVITCDDFGYGLGRELYLGSYTLVPRELPFGYAAPSIESRSILLERRTEAGAYAPIKELESSKTTVHVVASDEYMENSYIPGMTYALSSSDDPDESRVFTTNASGYFEITDLKKNTTYVLSEVDVIQGYITYNEPISFTVNSLGYIESKASFNIDYTYRMIRIEINTVDKIIKTPLSGYNVSLVNQSGLEVYSWVSDGSSFKIDGIDTGVYKLKIEGVDTETTIVVENIRDIQKFNASVLTTRSYLVLFGIGGVILLVLAIAIVFVLPKWIKNRKQERRRGSK